MTPDDQLHQAAIRGPRSPLVPAVIGALVGAALTFVVLQFTKEPPPPPPAPVVTVAEPVPCAPAAPAEPAAPVKTAVKRANTGQIANLLGRIDPVPAAPERHSASLDRDALGRFIRDKLPSIRMCYDRELKLNPSLKGKVVVRFDVTPAGRVGNGGIESDSMNDDRVGKCILTLMRGWSFPFHPSENTTVSFPFVFQPG